MIRINLNTQIFIPVNKGPMLVEVGFTFVAVVGMTLLAHAYAGAYQLQTSGLTQESEQMTAEIQSLQGKVKELAEKEAEIKFVEERIESMQGVTQGRQDLVLVMDMLQQNHLPSVWLEKLEFDEGSVTLNGLATDTLSISEYAARMKSVGESEPVSGIPRIKFSEIQLKNTQAQEEKTKEGNKAVSTAKPIQKFALGFKAMVLE